MIFYLLGLLGIVIIIAGCIFFWLVLKKQAEDESDEKFVCPHCNEKHCNCYKENELHDSNM